jgi:multiple sugar transport system substrate-binding protein
MSLLLSINTLSQDSGVVTLRIVLLEGELVEEEIALFEAANPDIRIEHIDAREFSYDMAFLLEQLPDVIRVQASDIPMLVRDGKILDITSYMGGESLISLDDLTSAANYYKVDGRYYGLPKDWSPDFSLYVYTPAFTEMGIAIPDTTTPLTYEELFELAASLTKKDGDTVTQYGFYTYFLDSAINSILLQRGLSMFNEDFSAVQLTNHPEVLEVIRAFYDMALNGTMYPYPMDGDGWGDWSISGKIAILQYGYWFGGSLSPEMPIYDNLIILPAPTWDTSLPRLNTTIGPIGISILSTSQHPEEAYRFFEWYIAGDAGQSRAKSGWGVPALQSLLPLLPQESAFDQQRFSVLTDELRYSDWVLPIYPYNSIRSTFNDSWTQNIQLAMAGEIDFDVFVSSLEDSINLAILSEQIDQ